jgi:hypothetical protein
MMAAACAFGPPYLNSLFDKLQLSDQVFADIAITDSERFGTAFHCDPFFRIEIFPCFKNMAKGG